MRGKVDLDAMINRADFAQKSSKRNFNKFSDFQLSYLERSNPISHMLRKPDFQRETNQWSPTQIATLVNSYAQGELIPSLILWHSNSHIFVIDGAHRLSALKAWIENDYGDKYLSQEYLGSEISQASKRKAQETRKLVEAAVGRYSDIKKSYTEMDPEAEETESSILFSTVFSRGIPVQWIEDDSHEVAETSFFKINSQGTPLDPTEEFILRNRKKGLAIAARAVVRAGKGHRYWSAFEDEAKLEIEKLSKELSDLILQPEYKEPLRSLELPIGGNVSTIHALKTMLEIMSLVFLQDTPHKAIKGFNEDADGTDTINVLKKTYKVVSRITGDHQRSLGLHPAIYFYNQFGKHSRFMFLGVVRLLARKVHNNDSAFFKKFTQARQKIEEILISKKSLIVQALANTNNSTRIVNISNMIDNLVVKINKNEEVDDNKLLELLGIEGTVADIKLIDPPKNFSTQTKSAGFINIALDSSIKCNICGGHLEPSSSVSHDHITPKRSGGAGTVENHQLTHPYCNTGYKS